mmetsp:Transcript_137788/g.326424  ORF Transcript_137788/g.326424 Transcript_137788/m.326424 type:complete len:233 (+) Transcript_137788:680-1378(+)
MASKGDLTRHLVASRQEVAEGLLREAVHLGHLAKEAELGVHGQGREAQAQDAVELEGHEGLLGHLTGQDHPELGAILPRGGVGGKAHCVPHKLPGHLARAEGDVHLVPAGRVLLDRVPVVVQVHCGVGRIAEEAMVPSTGFRAAGRGGNEEVRATSVKNNGEGLLPWVANVDLAKVGRLVGHNLVVSDHWDILLIQRDGGHRSSLNSSFSDKPSDRCQEGEELDHGSDNSHG